MKPRYFECYDNGCSYSIVASDLEHAQKILADAGVVFVAISEAGPGVEPVEWTEITHDAALLVRINDPDRADPDIQPNLTHYNLGDWFSSEY